MLSTGAGAALLLLAMQHPEAFMTLVTWIGEQKTADVLERAEGFMLELARRDLPNRPRGPIAV